MENVAREVEERVRLHPEKTALVEWVDGREKSLDFATFGRQAAALSLALSKAGVGKGERVLLLLPMGAPLYLSMVAIIRLGAVCVFVDPYMGRKRFDACCAAVKPKAFIGIPKGHLFRLLCPSLRKVPIQVATRSLPLAADMRAWIRENLDAPARPPARVDPGDSALISFTTGSSGQPKGSNRTHAFLQGQLQALDLPIKRACDSDFPGFPILPLENLARGRTTLIPAISPGKPRESGPAVLRQLERWKPEMMSGSPAYLEAVADAALDKGLSFNRIKALFTGGAPITARALEKLSKVWPSASIAVVYGSTEAEPVSMLGIEEILGECRPGMRRGLGFCVGRPIAAIAAKILPLDFRASEAADLDVLALEPGQVGEIAVCGAHVNTGYWDNPEGEKANKIRTPHGIWHRMGDAGYFDSQGRLWVVGRAHAAMKNPAHGGGASGMPGLAAWPWLFPYQAECVADEFPEVRKSAYFEEGGKFWLVVEALDPKPGLESDLRAALAGFPLDRVAFHASLPVDPRHNSKVEYGKLRDWARKGRL